MNFDELFVVNKGKKPPELFDEPSDGSIPFIKIEGIRNAGNNQYCQAAPGLVTCSENDVLIVWDGAYSGLVGFGLQGAIGSTIARLRPKSEKVFGPYAGRFFQSKFEEIQKNATGAAIPHVNGGYLRRLEIPLPPLDEQKRIAAVLDKADALRRQRQESLQLTEKLLQSVFIDMFGDPSANPKEWETLPLEELCEKIVDCPHSTPVYSDAASGFFCVRSSDIQNGKLDLASTRQVTESVFMDRIARHEPKAGEVIYTREGGRLGFAAQVPQGKRVCLGQRMMLFKAKEKVSTNTFLANLLNTESFRRKVLNLVGGGAAPRVNIKDLRTIVVYRPPFDLQERFEAFAASLQNQEKSLAQSANQTRRLFESLQQRAFRGELDLSRLKLDQDAESPAVAIVAGHSYNEGVYNRPGYFIAPPEIEAQMMALEDRLDNGPGDFIPWSEDYFKYRTLSQLLLPPFSFSEIWEKVEYDMEEASYETVKDKVIEYVAEGILEQQFDEERKEIVFYPHP